MSQTSDGYFSSGKCTSHLPRPCWRCNMRRSRDIGRNTTIHEDTVAAKRHRSPSCLCSRTRSKYTINVGFGGRQTLATGCFTIDNRGGVCAHKVDAQKNSVQVPQFHQFVGQRYPGRVSGCSVRNLSFDFATNRPKFDSHSKPSPPKSVAK